MRRAAASSTASDPPSAKRQKIANPSTPTLRSSDVQATEAAVAAEEWKRASAIDRANAEKGETKWVLSFKDEGTGARDSEHKKSAVSEDDKPWGTGDLGRRSWGRFNRAVEVCSGTLDIKDFTNIGRESYGIVHKLQAKVTASYEFLT